MQDSDESKPKSRMSWPLQDVLCAMRKRWRKHHLAHRKEAQARRRRSHLNQSLRIDDAEQRSETQKQAEQLGVSRELLEDHRRSRLYPYTKGIDLTNEGLGYGEQVQQELASLEGGHLEPKEFVSRLTRSGRQPVDEGKAGEAPGPWQKGERAEPAEEVAVGLPGTSSGT